MQIPSIDFFPFHLKCVRDGIGVVDVDKKMEFVKGE